MDHRTYLKIDLNKLEHNYNSVRNKLPNGIKLLGVIKANAYGNGAVESLKAPLKLNLYRNQ